MLEFVTAKKNLGQNSFQGHKMVIFIGSNLADCTIGPFCELKSFLKDKNLLVFIESGLAGDERTFCLGQKVFFKDAKVLIFIESNLADCDGFVFAKSFFQRRKSFSNTKKFFQRQQSFFQRRKVLIFIESNLAAGSASSLPSVSITPNKLCSG